MKFRFFASALIAALSITPLAASAEEAAHIADNAPVFYHSGPSSQYRISGRVRSGEAVTILQRNNQNKYVQIRTEGGRTGWMSQDLVSTGPSQLSLLPSLQADLESSQQLAEQRQMSISQLQADLTDIKVERDELNQQVSALKEEITRLSNSMQNLDSSNLMRWFTYGGLVAFGGILLGAILASMGRKPKRQSDW